MPLCPHRCPACPDKDNPKPPPQPTGPQPARVLVVGEGPAEEEMKQGRVFAGKTGQELDGQYLPIAGLDRSDVRVTNASLCPGRKKKGSGIDNPTVKQARACAAWHLNDEIVATNPSTLVLMGSVAIEAVLGRSLDLEAHHGIPVQHNGMMDWLGVTIVPTYHPAAGLHDGAWMTALQDDFRRLRKLIRGDFSDVATDPHAGQYEYVEVSDGCPVTMPPEYVPVGADTEYAAGKPYCMTLAYEPNRAYYIDADNARSFALLNLWRGQWVLWNALADLGPMRQMGVTVRKHGWVDGMQLANYAQEFRNGLKVNAFRYLGMQMHDYSDIVKPPSMLKLHEYASCAVERMKTAVPDKRGAKTLTEDEAQVRKTKTLVKRLVTDIDKNFDKPDFKPWDRFKKWEQWKVEWFEAFGGTEGEGGMPRPSIRHVPREDAVPYACMDAIAAWRLRPIMMEKVRKLKEVGA
jgi:uracil-DNA glycosylase